MRKTNKNEKDVAPIRVLHLIDRLTGYGTTKLLWDIIRLSPPNKITHFVVTFSPDKGKWPYADRLREKGVYRQIPRRKIFKFTRSRRPMAWFTIRFISAWWNVFQTLIRFRPDVIHIHGFYVLPIGLLLKVVFRRPVVHVVPSLFSQMVDEGKSWVPKFYARFHPSIDCFFTGILSRGELLSIGIPGSKVLVVRGAIDYQEISIMRHERQQYYKTIREELNLPTDALIALSVGRLDPSKGHIFALEAIPALLRKFPSLHWVVLGKGKQLTELEGRAQALNISPHVHFLGHRENPLPYYAAATVYLRTMIFENINLATYQAMAMGLPVVGFDMGCETDLLKKVGHGILVPNKCAEDLSVAVAQILALPDQGKEIGNRSLEFSQKNLDIRQAIEDMVTVSENLKNGVGINIKINIKNDALGQQNF